MEDRFTFDCGKSEREENGQKNGVREGVFTNEEVFGEN